MTEEGPWTVGAVNQEDFEQQVAERADAEFAVHENQLDEKRLEKVLKQKQATEMQLSLLERKCSNSTTLISQKEKARNELKRVKADLDQLRRDERDIRGRIRDRNEGTAKDPDETEHDFLVRTGKITPFSKEPPPSDEVGENYDHRELLKPAQAAQIEKNVPVGPDVFPDITTRDDGILEEYKNRLAKWNSLHDHEPEEYVIDGDFKIPKEIWKRLFGYQKTGARWLWELYRQKVGGIIGDEMGLGKTVQVAAFLAGLQFSNMLQKPALIVCPATVIDQWVNELHQWWPPLRVSILHSIGTAMGQRSADDLEDLEDDEDLDAEVLSKSMKSARALITSMYSTGHVIVTTYSGVNIYEKYLTEHHWGYCCLDEGHKIRNPDSEVSLACKQIKTPYRLILSGTPIQNNLTELWSLFDFIFPGRLGTLPVFQQQFSVPINVGGYANATNIQVQTAYKCAVVLRDMIAPYMLRRMKVDVASDLPAKTEKVLFCKLTKPQRQQYLAFLKGDEMSSILKGKRQVLFGVDILRKICNHPDLVLKDTSNPDYGDPTVSGKMQVVKALLELWQQQCHRALLFSQTRQMLDILEALLREMGISYLRMDGSTQISQRQRLVDEFNSNERVMVFLLTTKVGGLGVNLTGANRVVIYDPDWNPSTDVQARERAWRLGQKKEVMIYRLMIAGSIEEKIYQRQIFKQFLTNKILKDPKQKRFFKNTDLHDLFKLGDGTESAELFQQSSEPPEAKRRKTGDDLSFLEGVSKESDFQSPAEDESKAHNNAPDREESDILEGIFAKAGVQSTLEHDAVIDASRADTVLMEREAERVATQAAEVLRESRRETRKAKIGTPTWTGRSGLAGIIRKSKQTAEETGRRSSSKLLQNLRQKRELETQFKSSQILESGELKQHVDLMHKVKEYLSSRRDHSASSADVVAACGIKLDGPQEVSNLRQILKKVATWENKKWRLQE